ncbi:MAG TPA: phosphogluconate dehydrogenase (NADP(+)-dependent, decarboxylating), partial [Gammaproteobacteria bacterium]|nr:phosphogluconate dehydrogenase (NADP(+)-dependent, decarboxylating) [Gammaproteobacteria bacterium]
MNNIGLIGLGVMGRNLALNLLDCDIKVVAWNLEPQFSAKLAGQYSGNNLTIAKSLRELVRLLDRPRSI